MVVALYPHGASFVCHTACVILRSRAEYREQDISFHQGEQYTSYIRVRVRILISHFYHFPRQALTQWWNRYHPIVMDFVREYGALLVAFILPFTPRAARRSGYRGESTHVLRALDRLDAGLPGGGRGWAERWMSRPRGCRDSCPRGVIHLEKKVGGVGAAAAAVVVAAGKLVFLR